MKSRRIFMCVAGVLICAVSVGFFKLAAFGVDPFQTFMSGMDQLIPIDFGTLYVLVNAALLLFSLVFDRHYIGLATFINLFLLGYVVDFSHSTLLSIFPDASLPLRCGSFLLGFVALCFSSSLYMTADLGVSTYDAVALIMANTWKKGQFKFIRVATDVCCVVIGCVLYLAGGGEISAIPTIAGFGTIVTAFCMGPLIDFFNRKFSVPYLEKANK